MVSTGMWAPTTWLNPLGSLKNIPSAWGLCLSLQRRLNVGFCSQDMQILVDPAVLHFFLPQQL